MTFSPSNSEGAFLDPILILPEDEIDMRYRAKDLYEQVADTVNLRDIAIYPLVEVETGQTWFVPGNPQRYYDGWRIAVQIPDVASGMSSAAIPHKIAGLLKFTRYWAQATDGTLFYQIPWVNAALTAAVEIDVSATAVTIKNGLATNLTGIFAVLEYIKGAA